MNNKKTQNINIFLIVLVLLVGFMAGIVGSAVTYSFIAKEEVSKVSTEPKVVVDKVTQLQDESIINVVADTTPSVVSIVARKDIQQYRQLSPMDLFFGQPQQPSQRILENQEVGGGTGFFMTNDGMIVTNKHVVFDPAADYSVITSEGKEYPAKVLARDDVSDFAVLKIEALDGEKFSAATFGDSDKLQIGQTVVAIGNSLGEFSHSVSRGIISGMKRDIVAGGTIGGTERLTDIIQTDAAINPGNSGGPLIDLDGKVIGINTAIAQGAENIGFAIPINQVTRLIEDVKENGFISRPFLGVRYVMMTPEIAAALGVSYKNGVIIARGQKVQDFAVLPGSPADNAGIVENDIILKINGNEITPENTLSKQIAQYTVGDTIILTIWHKGEEMDVEIILEDKRGNILQEQNNETDK
jgi:serine protease Do